MKLKKIMQSLVVVICGLSINSFAYSIAVIRENKKGHAEDFRLKSQFVNRRPKKA